MEVFTIRELVDRLLSGPPFDWPEGPYVDMAEWERSPETARLYVFDVEEYEEAGGMDRAANAPFVASSRGLRSLLVMSDLSGVIDAALHQDPNASLRELIEAIDYYREYDSFKPA